MGTDRSRKGTLRRNAITAGLAVIAAIIVVPGTSAAGAAASDPTDAGSLAAVTGAIGARSVWGQIDEAGRAITGQGVTVAVLDSGVAAVPGLDSPGKILRGPDLSMEANRGDAPSFDTFGHGTHLAGIIAAKDPVELDPHTGAPNPGDDTAELGIAPDARVLALKLAPTNGTTDVSQVIAALDWVTQHRAENNVRVVNLSFGTTAVEPYQVDPLAAAAERAWRSGIVVVASGGNDGRRAGTLTSPATDPCLIAVGASDTTGIASGRSPSVAEFSSRGTADRHVDLVAPGRSVVALRAPGSFVDRSHPEGRVADDDAARLMRGSGTSQAAAVVSGAVALLLQANPDLSPDQVKSILISTASPIGNASAIDAGSGQVDVAAAVEAARAIDLDGGALGSPERVWTSARTLGVLAAVPGDSWSTGRWSTGRWSTGRWSTGRWSTDGWGDR
ncbi:S8 family serine peptidase [Pengzhenrongella phosphoraccumulans]|uniref:S8 family serine peptidase n=1 Tax=Pengzhenrongella phosphoraccumulans TaxID=3114394 RepID=UPI00388F1ED0